MRKCKLKRRNASWNIKMRKCKMWKCENAEMRKCENAKMWVEMSKRELKHRNAKMWKCKLRKCEIASPNVKTRVETSKCQNIKMRVDVLIVSSTNVWVKLQCSEFCFVFGNSFWISINASSFSLPLRPQHSFSLTSSTLPPRGMNSVVIQL